LKKFFKDLRKKFRAYLFPEPEPEEIQSVYKGRTIIFTVDKVEGNTVLYAIDFGKTFHVTKVGTSDENSDWLNNISLDKWSIECISLGALRITQRKGGKE